jgi:hypothetical protein
MNFTSLFDALCVEADTTAWCSELLASITSEVEGAAA